MPAEKGEKLIPGPSVRPRDAATLVLVRRDGKQGPRVLMGKRHGGHVFMPNKFVFPGGRVDPSDGRLPAADKLRAGATRSLLRARISEARAKALAMAAIRETFEETGVIIGKPQKALPVTRSKNWAPFYETGHMPQLGALDYMFRAITPPQRVRRFDTRFFLVFADEVAADVPEGLTGSGELVDLDWIPLSQSRDLDVPAITHMVLGEVMERVDDPARKRPVPSVRFLNGKPAYEEH